MRLTGLVFLVLVAGCASAPQGARGPGSEPLLVADAAPGEEVAPSPEAGGSGDDAAAEMARKLQDPLANITAVMTDNDILFNTGKDETSYQFQIQPVKAFAFEDEGFNFIARGVIPIMGIAPLGQIPPVGEPLPRGGSRTWGMGDIIAQTFFSPRDDAAWKWGLGPQASFKTRTDSDLGGPGWGAGPVGVLVGNLTENLSSSFILGHLCSDTPVPPTSWKREWSFA